MISLLLKFTLEFITNFIEENNRPPRLKELAEKLEITNKAVLDRLNNLQKAGYIEMPDGVLSLRLKNSSNDIFISYAKKDQKIAKEIYDFLTDEGFNVWKDNMKLKTGDDFTEEILENIKRSKCIIILLSKEAVSSNFVLEEIKYAKFCQVKYGKPLIFPIKISSNLETDEIPTILESIQYTTLRENFDHTDLSAIAHEVHLRAYQHEYQKEESIRKSPTLKSFKTNTASELKEVLKNTQPPEKDYPYRECTISPIGNQKEYTLPEIDNLVKNSVIKIQGWGGERFPDYKYDYNQKATYKQGRILITNFNLWPEKAWGFNFWSMDKNLNFFTRATLRESFYKNIFPYENLNTGFSMEWLILDICRPLMFVKKLQINTDLKDWNLEIKYHGLIGRELIILSKQKMGFLSKHQSAENDINFSYNVNTHTNLQELAYAMCHEILTIFTLTYINEDSLRQDIETLFKGDFPK